MAVNLPLHRTLHSCTALTAAVLVLATPAWAQMQDHVQQEKK